MCISIYKYACVYVCYVSVSCLISSYIQRLKWFVVVAKLISYGCLLKCDNRFFNVLTNTCVYMLATRTNDSHMHSNNDNIVDHDKASWVNIVTTSVNFSSIIRRTIHQWNIHLFTNRFLSPFLSSTFWHEEIWNDSSNKFITSINFYGMIPWKLANFSCSSGIIPRKTINFLSISWYPPDS